jgi:hypothetical protein
MDADPQRHRKKKDAQLGEKFNTANYHLKKMVWFDMMKRYGENICFRCKEAIETVEELSIEHKIPWLNKPNAKELFWDLNNVAWSHISCNSKAARRGSAIIRR